MLSRKSKRRIVREKVLQILYAYELNEDSLTGLKHELLAEINDLSDKAFAADLINNILKHKEDFDKRIEKRVANWEMHRIALIDKILLRIGICELFYFPDIPPKVTINESIEIAKEYSTAGSGKFINGILDAILAEERKVGKLNKTGRGLVSESITHTGE